MFNVFAADPLKVYILVPSTVPPFALMTNEFVVVPPLPAGATHVPSALKKAVVPPPEAGASPFKAEPKVLSISVTSAGDNGKGVTSTFVLFPKIEFSGIVFVEFTYSATSDATKFFVEPTESVPIHLSVATTGELVSYVFILAILQR
jgi:hypothetical protein